MLLYKLVAQCSFLRKCCILLLSTGTIIPLVQNLSATADKASMLGLLSNTVSGQVCHSSGREVLSLAHMYMLKRSNKLYFLAKYNIDNLTVPISSFPLRLKRPHGLFHNIY